jgi:hypothetical protein
MAIETDSTFALNLDLDGLEAAADAGGVFGLISSVLASFRRAAGCLAAQVESPLLASGRRLSYNATSTSLMRRGCSMARGGRDGSVVASGRVEQSVFGNAPKMVASIVDKHDEQTRK